MAIGNESTAAQYQQRRPLQVKTGDELDKYFVDQERNRAAAKAAKDQRKKDANAMAKAAALPTVDTKHKFQEVTSGLHAELTVENLKNLQNRDRLAQEGKTMTPEYQATFAEESRIKSVLPQWKAAFDATEGAVNDLAEGMEKGDYSQTRNLGLTRKLAELNTGSGWKYVDGKMVTTDAEGKTHAFSPTEMQSNPYLFEKPKRYADWDKWITDTAKAVGTMETQYEDPNTGMTFTNKDVKDVNQFRNTLRAAISANPDLLEEYQAAHNGIGTPDDQLATVDDMIDDVVEESNLFGDKVKRQTYTPPKDDQGKHIQDNIVPVSSSNTIVWDKDGNEIQAENPTWNSVDLSGTVKGATSGDVSTVMMSWKDAKEVDIRDKDGKSLEKVPSRIIKPYNRTVQGFVAGVVEEEDVYTGPRVFIRGLKEGQVVPEEYKDRPAEYFKTKEGNMLTRAFTDSDLTKMSYGMYLEPGQYVPRGMMEGVSKGGVAVYSTDNDGKVTDTAIPTDNVYSNATRTALVKGVDKYGVSMDIPIDSGNAEFIKTINGESKGYIYKYLKQVGRDTNGNPIATPKEEYREEVKEGAVVATGNEGKTTKEIKEEVTTVKLIGPNGKTYTVPADKVDVIMKQNPTFKKQ